MDQLKPLVKYHFWILCGVVVLSCIGAGIWATLGQADVIKKQMQAISTAQGQAKGVMDVKADVGENPVSVHPNEKTNKGMNDEISSGRKEVLQAWKKLHDEQKDLLGWPQNILEKSVADTFDALHPERMAFEVGATEKEVREAIRKRVKVTLPAVLPKLADSIRAKWNEAEITGEESTLKSQDSAEAKKDDMELMMTGQALVDWSVADQSKWYGLATNFKGRNGNKDVAGTPTTMQILYLKEDLVLLNGVLEIIKSANQDATIPNQASVKTIQSIMLGKEAHEATPMEIASPGGGGGGMGADQQQRMADMLADYAKNLDDKARGGGDEETVSEDDKARMDPANMRYVDKDFKPIPASEYRNAVTSTDLSEKSWMAVVKRVPVRLRLMVDERKIGDLLEKCANAKIPLEVRQITLIGGDLPKDPAAAAAGAKKSTGGPRSGGPSGVSGGGGGAGGETMTLGADPNDKGDGAGAVAGTAGEKTYSSAEFNSHFNVPLEIYGIMKIYNEPAPEAIGDVKEGATGAPST